MELFPTTKFQCFSLFSVTALSVAYNIIYFFALSTPAAQDHFSLFTFLLDTDTVKIIALCTIGSDPFLHLETLCVNMFSLCVCICDLCMYVGEVYKCISVFVYVYKLLDDLNFPRD